ncbi:hypothetical protein DHEL01_v211725 [Diaporthe helianthi]|uniref:Uncharacterized protein n=1 Tax=Diaporthe helianthi TaxID=158607 RepID=A0A2P5HI15_DIAHE|nr:hypothetical protein DHEL01_v211725 [Diaporthe helianthi]
MIKTTETTKTTLTIQKPAYAGQYTGFQPANRSDPARGPQYGDNSQYRPFQSSSSREFRSVTGAGQLAPPPTRPQPPPDGRRPVHINPVMPRYPPPDPRHQNFYGAPATAPFMQQRGRQESASTYQGSSQRGLTLDQMRFDEAYEFTEAEREWLTTEGMYMCNTRESGHTMEENGNSYGMDQNSPQHPSSDLAGLSNDDKARKSPVASHAEAGASASRDQVSQDSPQMPGWNPKWVRFVIQVGKIPNPTPNNEKPWRYSMTQITEFLHAEFGAATYTLTEDDVMGVWQKYAEELKEKARMHQNGPSGTIIPAGGPNGDFQLGNGHKNGALNDSPGGLRPAASLNADDTARNGQYSRYEDYDAHHTGASSSDEGAQASQLAHDQFKETSVA